MNLKTLLDYLTRTAPPEDVEANAALLLERLASENAQVRSNAELVLTRIGYEWESFYEEAFVVAVLDGLAGSDLTETIPEVERIITRGGRTEAKRRVIAMAKICLDSLERKHREQWVKRELLRPSAPSAVNLLRPAVHAPNDSPENLLRAK